MREPYLVVVGFYFDMIRADIRSSGCWNSTNSWYMETLQKMETNVHAAPEKNSKCTKKDTLGLTAGHGVIMSPCLSLWPRFCRKHGLALMLTEVKKNGWMIRWMFARELENHEIP